MSRAEHFPQTERTWLLSLLGGDPADVRTAHRRIMEIYAGPLEVYAQAVMRRRSEDAKEIVHGFFVSRLARLDYIARWNPQTMRLSRWLMNGLCFYMRERKRERSAPMSLEETAEIAAPVADLAPAIDREFAASVVRDALRQAERLCESQGLAAHWRVFLEHQVRGRSYRDLESEFGARESRLAIMCRTATKRFVEAVRTVLRLDGASESLVTSEVRAMIGHLDES